MTPDEVVDHLVARGTWSFSRASGPGGQRRDKASTRAELTIDDHAVADLPTRLGSRLARGLGLNSGPLRISAQDHRERERNRAAVVGRLRRRVRSAMAPPPRPRRATRPSRAARERRLAGKKGRSRLKQTRRRPDAES